MHRFFNFWKAFMDHELQDWCHCSQHSSDSYSGNIKVWRVYMYIVYVIKERLLQSQLQAGLGRSIYIFSILVKFKKYILLYSWIFFFSIHTLQIKLSTCLNSNNFNSFSTHLCSFRVIWQNIQSSFNHQNQLLVLRNHLLNRKR